MPSSTPEFQALTIRLPRETYEAIRLRAFLSRTSMTKLIDDVLVRAFGPNPLQNGQEPQQLEQEKAG